MCEKEVSHVAHKVGQWTNDSCANVGQGSSHDGVTQGLIGPTLVRVYWVGTAVDDTIVENC